MRRGFSRLHLAFLGALACAGPETLHSPPDAAYARSGPRSVEPARNARGEVLVRFPIGACATGWLEVEEFVRQGGPGGWRPHAGGARMRAGTCRFESPERLLSEIRVRCIDPTGVRPPSAWVRGVALDETGRAADCPEPHASD